MAECFEFIHTCTNVIYSNTDCIQMGRIVSSVVTERTNVFKNGYGKTFVGFCNCRRYFRSKLISKYNYERDVVDGVCS